MALVEWTDANGHRWQADVADADDIAPEYLPQSPRAQGMRRVSVKRGARWQRRTNGPQRQAPQATATPNALLPASDVPESPVEVYGKRELAAATQLRQSRLDNGGRWQLLTTLALQARRADAKRRALPGVPYMGRQKTT